MPSWCCDATVLRLGRELRALGFHVTSTPGPRRPGQEILLTRSRRALADRDLRSLPTTVVLKSARFTDQLRALDGLFGISRSARPWTRCVRCGGDLEPRPPEDFRGMVPDFVVESSRSISACVRCGHLFWRATHTSEQEAVWRRVFLRVMGER